MFKGFNLIFALTFIIIFIGCKKANTISDELCRIDSLLTSDKDSIAMIRLNEIHAKVKKVDDMAYYNLLKVRAMYKLDIPIKNDSIIDSCIRYYKKCDDKKMLAEAYYYKSEINYERFNIEEGVKYMKMAEKEADLTDDDGLKYKIYEQMVVYNGNAGEHEMALNYGRKSLYVAQKVKNNDFITSAYLNLATSNMRMGEDSARFYVDKCIENIKYLRPQGIAYLYDIIGGIYKENNNKYAETYLKKAIDIYPLPWTYKKLAELYLENEEEDEANRVWEKALNFDADKIVAGFETKIGIYEAMRELKQKYGRHDEADSIAGLIIMLKDSMRSQKENLAVREMQKDFDNQVNDEKAEKRRQALAWWLAAAVVTIVGTSVVYYAVHRRDKHIIDLRTEKETAYKQKITELTDGKKKAESKMRKTEREAQDKIARQAGTIAAGRRLAQSLDEGGSVAKWSNDDYRCAMEYYRTVDGDFITHLEKDYEGLTGRNMLFATLRHLNKTDDELERILGVTPSALRAMKTRISKKEKK